MANSNLSGTISRLNFSDLPQYIKSKFRPTTEQKVILLFIDGFGWNSLNKHISQTPSLEKLVSRSQIYKNQSLFPSSTPAHLSTIQGEDVYETGVTEWLYFKRFVGRTICPLMFSFAGDSTPNKLSCKGIKGSDIFSIKTIYQELNNKNIPSKVYLSENLINSEFSKSMCVGSQINGYSKPETAMTDITSDIINKTTPGYYFLYYDKLDKISHKYGYDSIEVGLALDNLFSLVENYILKPIYASQKPIELIICSDHGQINCPNTLDLDDYIYQIRKYFRKGSDNNPLIPGGSGRDVSLYIEQSYVEQVKNILLKSLTNKAKVVLVSEFIKTNLINTKQVSSQYTDSLGDVLILAEPGYQFWWKELGESKKNCVGNHGGFAADETETPLIIYSHNPL